MTDLSVKYMFSISAPFAPRWIGRTPSGHRIDLDYDSSLSRDPGGTSAALVTTDLKRLGDDWPLAKAALDAEALLIAADAKATAVLDAKVAAMNKKLQDSVNKNAAVLGPLASSRADLDKQVKLAAARVQVIEKKTPVDWLGVEGEVVSGMDWALLRSDSVIEFDGRFTLKDEEGMLINAQVFGSVDMVKPGDERPMTLEQAAERLKDSKAGDIGFAVSFRFEAAQEPEPWADKRYKHAGALKYRRLSQGQLIGAGVLTSFANANPCFHVDVFYIEPPAKTPWQMANTPYRLARQTT